MKKHYPGIIMFLLVLLVFINSKANAQVGNEAIAISSMNAIDSEPISLGDAVTKPRNDVFENGVYMNASEGNNMAIMRFLLSVDNFENTEALKISVQAKGEGRLSAMYAEQIDDKLLGTHFDINGFGGICVFYAMPAKKYVNDDGVVEIHIIVSDGQALDIGTITVESLAKKPAEVRLVKSYDFYPPDYQRHESIFYAYYTGPYYVSRSADYTYVAYDNWWTLPGYVSWRGTYEPMYIARPVRTIYSQPAVYLEARCAPVYYYNDRGYLAPGKLVKVSERRATVQQVRVHERISSVEGNGSTKRNFQPQSYGLVHDDALRNGPTKRNFQGNGGNAIKLAPSQLNAVETKSVNTNSSGQQVKTFRPEQAKVQSQPQSQQERTSSIASKADSRTILDMNGSENRKGIGNNRAVQMPEQIRTRTQSTLTPSVQPVQKVQKSQTAPVQKVQATPVQKVQKSQTAPVQKVQATPVQKVQKVQTTPVQKVQATPVQKVQKAQTAPVQKVQATPVQKVQKAQTAPAQKVQATPVQKKDDDEDKDKDKDKDKESSTKKKRSK